MDRQILYFDQAATSYPKPEVVYKAHDEALRHAANPGRGGHRLAMDAARAVFEARVSIAEFLGITQAQRLIFTPGCTHSINMALKGWPWQAGDAVVTSSMEHNAVMRPLRQLQDSAGIHLHTMSYGASLDELQTVFKDLRPKLLVMAEASNVTGEIVDLTGIAQLCRIHDVALMVDAAQSAGFVPQKISQLGISLWCASGHKGLFGPPGVGLLYVAPDVELGSLISGGTGSRSEDLFMPSSYPDHLESGTMNAPAIAALAAGVAWIGEQGLDNIADKERALSEQFRNWCLSQARISLYGTLSVPKTGIVAFSVDNIGAGKVADLLDQGYGIAVRSGLHCAPLAHQALGTSKDGLVRASFGWFNDEQQVEQLCRALGDLID